MRRVARPPKVSSRVPSTSGWVSASSCWVLCFLCCLRWYQPTRPAPTPRWTLLPTQRRALKWPRARRRRLPHKAVRAAAPLPMHRRAPCGGTHRRCYKHCCRYKNHLMNGAPRDGVNPPIVKPWRAPRRATLRIGSEILLRRQLSISARWTNCRVWSRRCQSGSMRSTAS